jgi:flagellar basal body rod protein FlgG
MAYRIKQHNGSFHITDNLDNSEVGSSPVSTVSAKHVQLGPLCITTLTLDNVAQAVVNGTEYQGTKIYDFPAGRISVLGVTATLQQKTTSAIASTLNSGVTGAIALGTATASNVSLTSTMVDLLPSTAFASSTTINVAGTAVSAALAAAAQFDGTSTAKDVYLNTAYATTTDVDGNATQTISGTVVISWLNLGDY